MANLNEKTQGIKIFFEREDVKGKFKEMLGNRATQFITSVLQIANSNELLKNAEPLSLFNAAAVAATLDLPLNNNLGFAYIVPYKQKFKNERGQWDEKVVAQFQMGYKGFIQLSQRSGQFNTINAIDVREGEIKSQNRLTGEIQFEWIQDENERLKKQVIGFVSYFKLLNGFEKTYYMPIAKLKAHGVKYSQTFRNDKGLWKDDFESMAQKTVIKQLLSKYAPLSVEMQKAVIADQGVINNTDATDIDYVDNQPALSINKQHERIELLISNAETIEELDNLFERLPEELTELWLTKKEELSNASR